MKDDSNDHSQGLKCPTKLVKQFLLILHTYAIPSVISILRESSAEGLFQAVSVSLPTWRACVGYEEGEAWVVSQMKNGYPRSAYVVFLCRLRVLNQVACRFFVDRTITNLADTIVRRYAESAEQAYLFPSRTVAARCVAFFKQQVPTLNSENYVRILEFRPISNPLGDAGKHHGPSVIPTIAAVLFPRNQSNYAKIFWQHTGDGISSRRAELCQKAFDDGYLVAKDGRDERFEKLPISCHELGKGPRRYQKEKLPSDPQIAFQARENGNGIAAHLKGLDGKEHVQFLEERYGRNLDMSLASNAKLAIRRRIAGALTADVDLHEALEVTETPLLRTRHVHGFSEDDVYLWPSGMSSIFNTHRIMMASRGAMKSISYG